MLKTKWKVERRRILKYLDNCAIVDRYKHKIRNAGEYFLVWFKTGVRECWVAREAVHYKTGDPYKHYNRYNIPIGECLNDHEVVTYCEFETRHLYLNDFDHMFSIQFQDLKKAGFCPTRVKVHELALKLAAEGWKEPTYPLDVLESEFEELRESNVQKHQFTPNRIVKGTSGAIRGKKLYYHFLQYGDLTEGTRKSLKEAWKDPYLIYRATRYLISRKRDLTRTNIIDRMQGLPSVRSGPRIPNCNFWRAVIRKFAPSTKRIFDVEPGMGEKLLAAVCDGRSYGWEGRNELHEMSEFIGNKIPVGYDLHILSGLEPLDKSAALHALQEARPSIFLVSREAAEEVAKMCMPSRRQFYAPHQTWIRYKPDSIFYYDKNS